MDGYIPAQSFDKLQPALLLRLCLGAIGPVYEFGHRHDRQADLSFSLAGLYLFSVPVRGFAGRCDLCAR